VRIAIVVPYFSAQIGSNEYGLAKYLTEFGHDVTILASSRTTSARLRHVAMRPTTMPKIRGELPRVHFLSTPIDIVELPIMPTLPRELKLLSPDVVHAQEDYQPSSLLAYLATRTNKVPFIVSNERYYYPPHPWKVPSICLDMTIAKYVRDHASLITAHSNAARDFLILHGAKPQKTRLIHVGAETDLFKPLKTNSILRERLGFSDDALVILTVSRLSSYKGLDLALRAMGTIMREFDEVRYVIFGRGKEERRLKRQVARLRMTDEIRFVTRPLPHAEMPKMYSGCDIFLLPSRIEPYGLAALEAMSCGKAVIASRVGGLADIVADGETGFLTSPGNVDELVRSVSRLVTDERLRNRMGFRGRARAVQSFDWKRIVKQYIGCYESLLKR